MKPKFLSIGIAAAFLLLFATAAPAQNKFALKTNLLHDATATIDLGLEFAFAPRWTAEISGSFHPKAFDVFGDMKLQHMYAQPEVKYWFCESFHGAFIGLHAMVGRFTVGCFPLDLSDKFPNGVNFKNFGLDGRFSIGGGLNVGYALMLGRHWNLEFELGLGYLYARGDEYELTANADGTHTFNPSDATWKAANKPTYENYHYDYVGPTNLAISLVYIF
ncbi:MAG: DUF3575 domain-containing protein [Bacteroidales bacterium]|nr:DUF3575 domain-containing protein [Bacteroidales bacterium]